MRPLGPDSGCSGVTPTAPPVVTPTTPFVPINPSTPQNASEAIKFQVCKGKSLTINAPNYNLVYIEEINLRVQTIVNTVCLQITYLTPPPPSKKNFSFINCFFIVLRIVLDHIIWTVTCDNLVHLVYYPRLYLIARVK